MTCQQCGAACQGGLCKQCEIENAYEHRAAELRDDRERDESGHSSRLAQLQLAAEEGTLPDDIDAPAEVSDDGE